MMGFHFVVNIVNTIKLLTLLTLKWTIEGNALQEFILQHNKSIQ